MKEFTQSNIVPGNCWQTAVACILEVDPETMPQQHIVEADLFSEDAETRRLARSYNNVLNTYLFKHHGLVYTELYGHQANAVRMGPPGWHVLIGPTVRTDQNGRKHCVVGYYGDQWWDPHPSRAFLTKVTSWGLLVPMPDDWKKNWERYTCECPACCPTPPSP